MKLVGRYPSLGELFGALDSRAVVLAGGGVVKAHASHAPPGYISDTWLDGYQDRYDLTFDFNHDGDLVELYDTVDKLP